MSELKFEICEAQSPNCTVVNVTHSIEKRDSTELSRFQFIGYLLRRADAVFADNLYYTPSIMLSFGAELDQLGYDSYAPIHLLSAASFKIRMYAAWCIIGSVERGAAIQLDYNDVHNYWPSTEFCEPGWDDEVKRWVSTPSSYQPSVELKIAAAVGQPPRSLIMFAA
ncbi:hypothetical protein [Pseudomonas sp. NA-150]|uniref:hypothetical protein n=1 Tax=Pseudomonas sp. NA-150 TaxID=3367525 RepID=UPI0037CBC8DC